MKQMTRRLAPGLSALVLVFFLAACSGLSWSGGGAPPTPTHTPTPTPVPTQTAIGTGFTIGYPTDWTAQSSGQMGIDMVGAFVDMMDPLQVNAVSVFTASADPSLTNDQAATIYTYGSTFIPVRMQGAKSDPSVASTTTVGGDTWVQKAYTGTETGTSSSASGPNVPGRISMLVDVHHGFVFVLVYGGPVATFNVENTQNFQPMLQSFQFTI